MFHKHGSPTNQPKKNLIKRIVGACAMLAVLLALVATPALARGWGRTNGGSGTTSGAYCTTPGTHCENAGCTGFIDNDNDGICDSATALLARKTTKQITAPRTVKTPQAPMSGTMEIISLLFGMGKLSDSIIIVDRNNLLLLADSFITKPSENGPRCESLMT